MVMVVIGRCRDVVFGDDDDADEADDDVGKLKRSL